MLGVILTVMLFCCCPQPLGYLFVLFKGRTMSPASLRKSCEFRARVRNSQESGPLRNPLQAPQPWIIGVDHRQANLPSPDSPGIPSHTPLGRATKTTMNRNVWKSLTLGTSSKWFLMSVLVGIVARVDCVSTAAQYVLVELGLSPHPAKDMASERCSLIRIRHFLFRMLMLVLTRWRSGFRIARLHIRSRSRRTRERMVRSMPFTIDAATFRYVW